MNFPAPLSTIFCISNHASGKRSLTVDLRWITEYALTDAFSATIRLNASFEVFNRDTLDVVDRGYAVVTIFRAVAGQTLAGPAMDVRVGIDWFESGNRYVKDHYEEAHWYFDPHGLLVGFQLRGEAFAVEFDDPGPWHWVENAPMRIGTLQAIGTQSEPSEAVLFATLEAYDDGRNAFCISAAPADDHEASYGFTTWHTDPDGTPRAHFFSSMTYADESEVLVTLMINL